MEPHVRDRILAVTGADALERVALIQPLWNNYGALSRVHLRGGDYASVIVKHIQIPSASLHPRGFTGDLSRARKVRSYAVETHWYQAYNQELPEGARSPQCLDAFSAGGERILLLEDLDRRGLQVLVELLEVAARLLAALAAVNHALAVGHLRLQVAAGVDRISV